MTDFNRLFPPAVRVLGAALLACGLASGAAKPKAKVADTKPDAPSVVQVPVQGFVASQPAMLRPILGLPGAVVLGDPLLLPDDATRILLPPGQAYALVERSGAEVMGLVSLSREGAGVWQAIEGAWFGANRIAFSPNGSAAVLYSGATKQVQFLAGLPQSPRVVRQLDVGSLGDASVTALAVSDDAEVLLVGVSDGQLGTISSFDAAGPAAASVKLGVPSNIRFLPRSRNALIADAGWNQILLLEDVSGDFRLRVLADDRQGVSAPADAQISGDGKRVFVANTGAGNVLVAEIDSGSVAALACGCTPGTLERLPAASAFVLNGADSLSSWLWDVDSRLTRFAGFSYLQQPH